MSIEKTALSVLRGSFVADAACMGTHWIYDGEKLKQIVGAKISAPEFFSPPSCSFYNR